MADNDSEALRGAARKRIELKEAVSRVETAAASASSVPDWRAGLLEQLEGLKDALSRHVTEVEAPDGLLAELAMAAPRLTARIEQTRAEHPVLCHQTNEVIARSRESAVDEVRGMVLDLLVAVARHRQHGADLVYEVYEVDLGGG